MIKRFVLLLPIAALAHVDQHMSDWIGNAKLRDPLTNNRCCGIDDCKVAPFGGVIETADGYYVAEFRETVSSSRVIWRSPDTRWWICKIWNWDTGYPTVQCLIGPPPSS